MDEPINDSMVIYKLGQIESQLASISIRIAERDTQFDKDFTQFQAQFKTIVDNQNAQAKRISSLEGKWDAVRNWVVGGSFIITAAVAVGKFWIESWPK